MDANQARMARAALKLSVRELGELAKVSPNTVTRLEAGLSVNHSTGLAIQTALESAGVEFIAENGSGPGVRLKRRKVGVVTEAPVVDGETGKVER
jgi:transcriptional regulator with XRE-family HTH domain